MSMLRIFRILTKSIQENIAIDIIKSFEDNYSDSSYKIYRYDELLKNLISVIEKTINLDEYSKLTWKERDEAIAMIIKMIRKLEKNSENTVPQDALAYKNDGIKGMAMMNFEDEGWNYYHTWNELKFPDVFYKKEMQHILQSAINNKIKHTKFDILLIEEKKSIENKELKHEEKPLLRIKNPSETKKVNLIQDTVPNNLSNNLYPSLKKNPELKKPLNLRLYPDLDGYDLTPSISQPMK